MARSGEEERKEVLCQLSRARGNRCAAHIVVLLSSERVTHSRRRRDTFAISILRSHTSAVSGALAACHPQSLRLVPRLASATGVAYQRQRGIPP